MSYASDALIDALQKKVDGLDAENRLLHLLVQGLLHCADPDADAKECPFYSSDAEKRCSIGKVFDKLGIEVE